jgi:hypothetical protein
MLTIRREQMQVLNDYMQRNLEDRLARRLVLKFPDRAKALSASTGGSAHQAALALVRQGAVKAAEFGVSSATDVASFVDLLLVLGPDFERQAEFLWMMKILTSKTIPPEARMWVIFQRFPLRIPDQANLVYPTGKEI